MEHNYNSTISTCLPASLASLLAKTGLAAAAAGKIFLSPTLTILLLLIVLLVSIYFIFLIHLASNTLSSILSLAVAAATKISIANHPLPPGPVPWPIVGNLPELLRNKPAFRWIHDGIMKKMNVEIACIRLGNVHVIPVTSPEIAREFLKKQDAIFASRPVTMATEYASRGFLTTILTPWGDQWKKMRRVMTSEVVAHAKRKWFVQMRVEEADNLIFYIYNQCNINNGSSSSSSSSVVVASAAAPHPAAIDLRLVTRHYSGNVTRRMMFNKRYFGEGIRKDGGPGFEEVEHVDAIFTILSLVYAFAISDYLPWLRWLDLNGHEKLIKEAIRVLDKYHDPIIDERIRQRRRSHEYNDLDHLHHEPEDLLDVLISLKDNNGKPLLSLEGIKAQTAEMMYATVDNPSNAVEWAIAEMINQPDILRKAVDEIDMVVGKDRLVQESDFSQLNYVKACAREALRLHPIVPFNVPHMSNTDTVVAGYTIPKGSHVLLSRIGLGRNPKVWDEPLKFKPERHLMDEPTAVELTEPDLRFISFSTGRRGCIGASLGSAMTIMLLARLLQGFSWSVPPDEHSKIDLYESANDLFLAKPLRAHAEPRLPSHVYPNMLI